MDQDPIASLRKHYRSAWKGTVAGFVFIALVVFFAVEVNFSERFLGSRVLRRIAFDLALGGGFLVLLIMLDRKSSETIDKIRSPLIVGAMGYFFWFWMLSFTNRVGRNNHQYDRTVTVESIYLRFGEIRGTTKADPSHWSVKVSDEAGRTATFDGPLDRFDEDMRGKQITLSVVRGRWSQDFIAPFE